MSYGSERDEEYLNRLQDQITDFVSTYNANPNSQHTTILLFPGGLASRLDRAETPRSDGPPYVYDTAWLDCGILTGNFIDLQYLNGSDYENRYILPDKCIDWLTLRPYDNFIEWCQTNFLDLFIFGWDWRRSTVDAVDFFLNTFMPAFEARVAQECVSNPLENLWLIGHSFGGMVVKQIINHYANNYVRGMSGAITVGTSFYGYGGQVHRFFIGDPQVNWIEGANGPRIVTKIVSPLPAGYELLFLDTDTYNANQAAFMQDPDNYNLAAYPSVDAASGAPADPYRPVPGEGQSQGGFVRYISGYGFSWAMLADGLLVSRAVSQRLDVSIVPKFTNIRGVQGTPGNPANNTIVSQRWALVPSTFDPDSGIDGLTDILGPGDDTLPAWATRLLGNPNVVTVMGDDINHMDLMNHAEVQAAIGGVLQVEPMARRRMRAPSKTAKMSVASREDLNELLGELRKVPSDAGRWTPERKKTVRDILLKASGGDPNRLQEYFARAYLDALKSPQQIFSSSGGSPP